MACLGNMSDICFDIEYVLPKSIKCASIVIYLWLFVSDKAAALKWEKDWSTWMFSIYSQKDFSRALCTWDIKD